MLQCSENNIALLWPVKVFRKISKSTGEERIEADLQLTVKKLLPSNHPLKLILPIKNCRVPCRSITNFVPKYDEKLQIDDASTFFVDFNQD